MAKKRDDIITIRSAIKCSRETERDGRLFTFESYRGIIDASDYTRLGIDLTYQREPQDDEYVAKMKGPIARRRIQEVTIASRLGKYHKQWLKVRDEDGIERDQLNILVKLFELQFDDGNPQVLIVDGQSRGRAIKMMMAENEQARLESKPLPYPTIEISCHCILKTDATVEAEVFDEVNNLGKSINPNLTIRNFRHMTLEPNSQGEILPKYPVLQEIFRVTTEDTSFCFHNQIYWGVKLPQGKKGLPIRFWIRLLLELHRLRGARLATDNATMVQNLETVAKTIHLGDKDEETVRKDGGTQVVENFLHFCNFLNDKLGLSVALDQKVKPLQVQKGLLMAYARICGLRECWVGFDEQAEQDGDLYELSIPDDIGNNLSNIKILKDPRVIELAFKEKLDDRIALSKYILERYINPRRSATKKIAPELLDRRTQKLKKGRGRRSAKSRLRNGAPS
jgi:hypothetical protein